MPDSTYTPTDADIGHDSPWECDECGGPESETSHSGCLSCDGQGNIVARGTVARRLRGPSPYMQHIIDLADAFEARQRELRSSRFN